MKVNERWGVTIAPFGCGINAKEGLCFACTVRHARRGKFFPRLQQLLPLRYATVYTTGGDMCTSEGEVIEHWPSYANCNSWQMWLGKVFNHEHLRYEIVPETIIA